MTQWSLTVPLSEGYAASNSLPTDSHAVHTDANCSAPSGHMPQGLVPDVDSSAQGPDAAGQSISFQSPEHDGATSSDLVPSSGDQGFHRDDELVSEGSMGTSFSRLVHPRVIRVPDEAYSPQTQGEDVIPASSFAVVQQGVCTPPFGPTQNDISIFTSPSTPSTQYYSEACIADMDNLLCRLGSVMKNLHSISHTFVIDTRTGKDGSSIWTLLDVVLLATQQRGIYCSEISGRWDEGFRRQGLIALPGGDPATRDALYAHSRLVSSHQNNMFPRVLRLTTDPTLEIPLLESGNPTFSLPHHQAIEATLDYLQLHNSISPQMVIKCQPTLISTMEDLCEEWLIGILAITARLGSREEKKAYIAIHKQHMTNLAEMERDAAKQAAHDTCPLTFRPYQVMATMFQSAMHDLSISIIDSIMAGEVTNMRIPSPHEINLARYLGRTMVEWQIACFLMEPVCQASHHRHMKEYLAPLRNRFFSMSSHSRVPNYRCELSEVFSERRKELADYSSRGLIPRPFNPNLSTPWVVDLSLASATSVNF
ncbi:hypothetical protein B0H10DRAFT_2443934 [Mycena sp. CBHHK59/15]|nr:hypothetical protein B0H10DRAFT_2443934 [Mycena sp. CBHHK59/15]